MLLFITYNNKIYYRLYLLLLLRIIKSHKSNTMAESRDDRFVKKLDFKDENLSVKWKIFKSQFQILRIAKKYAEIEEEEQIANLLMLMGSDSVPIYNQFTFNADVEAQAKTLVNVLAMFDRYFEPVKNVIYERVKFNSLKQGDQAIHQFITSVQSQADNCDYGTMRDQLVRDRIVVGVNDNLLREQLIDIDNLDLPGCIRKAKQFVSHHAQAAKLTGESGDNVDMLRRSGPKSSKPTGEGANTSKRQCPFCNKWWHSREKCPARNSTCYACREKGHWAKSKACKGKASTVTAEVAQESESLDGLFMGSESE